MRTFWMIFAFACLLAMPAQGLNLPPATSAYDITLPPVPSPAPTARQLVGIAKMQLAVTDTFLTVWQGRLDLMRKELGRLDARVKSGLLQAEDPVRLQLLNRIASSNGRINRLRERQARIRIEYQLALDEASHPPSEESEPANPEQPPTAEGQPEPTILEPILPEPEQTPDLAQP